jgi:mono/diheme cytochrome c family protein
MKTLLALAGLMLATRGVWAQESGGLVTQGKTVFEDNCAQCHRTNGQGLPGTFPALNKNSFVTGDPKPVIATVLNGRKGTLGQMPMWKDDLNDQQIAAVITYIRQAWANQASAVPPAMVAEIRKNEK